MSYPAPAHSTRTLASIQFMALSALILILGLLGEQLNPYLLYQRDDILHGQVWRLLSAHIVHLGWLHTLMNLAALTLVILLFRGLLKAGTWLLAATAISLAISIGFLTLKPQLGYYAGLSGTIHGLLTLACIASLRNKNFSNWQSILLLLALVGKLFYEQSPWYNDDHLQQAMKAPVIVDAHLYGAIAGAGLALLAILRDHRRHRE